MCWGYRNYLAELVPRLTSHPRVEALLVGVPENMDVAEWRKRAPSVRWLPLRCALTARCREVPQDARKVIERFSPNVIFIPTARYWQTDGIPVVNMVRNMMPATCSYSAHYWDSVKNWARFVQMRRAVQKSSRVIAVSHFVGDYLSSKLGVSPGRIGVVYHGTESSPTRILEKPPSIPHDWRGRFAFVAGSIYPYRGLEDLISAWVRIGDTELCPFVVIAGFVGYGMQRYYDQLRALIRDRGLDSRIRFVGPLTKTQMTWCYRNCAAFVMTSRVEACPNIALEAMVHGCMCVSTDKPPMPEVFGDVARYYSAGDSQALAEQIRNLLHLADEKRVQMKVLSVRRGGQFTWEACCDRTVGELQRAVARQRH